MNTIVANLSLNNCVHTDGDTAAATPRERPLLCVRLLRVAVAVAVGHRGACACSGLDPPLPQLRWWSGRSATPPRGPRSTPPRRQEAAKFTHPAHRVVSILPQIRQFSVRKAGPSRPIPCRLADPSAAGARLAGWSRPDPTAVGTLVPSWFAFVRIGSMGMGQGCVGIRSVWVPGS
jgi:hypothetical protein